MSAQKKWNLQTFSATTRIFGSNSTYTLTCAGQNNFVNLNQADIVLSLSIVGLPVGATYTVGRPSTTWINQMNVQVEYITPEGPQIVNYNGYNNRGIAANVLETLEYSSAKYAQYDPIEFLSPQAGLTATDFEVLIPLKFLADAAYDANLVNVDHITFNITFISQPEIFTFTSGTPTVNCNHLDIKYPSWVVSSPEVIPAELREIPNRQVYVQNVDLIAGASAVNTQVAVPFPCSVLYYFFISKDSTYNMNPNPLSVVTSHSLTSMGEVFPLISNYGSSYTPGLSQVGIIRHYMELMDISGKDKPENNTILSFPEWFNSKRIYCIEIGVEQQNGQNFNFSSTFVQQLAQAATCVMLFLGRTHI